MIEQYKNEIISLLEGNNNAEIARMIIAKYNLNVNVDSFRKRISEFRNLNHVKCKAKVLVIPDIHAPFTKKDFLQFCKDTYTKYNCDTVVFIGDVLDNHFSSYHETSTNAYSAEEELKLAKLEIAKWYNAFPKAFVMSSNHDLIFSRKLNSAGLAQSIMKPLSDILNTPNWKFSDYVIIDNVYYNHGLGSKAERTALLKGLSAVQGHYHTDTYIKYHRKDLWGMQLPMGIDIDSYAFEYNKFNNKEVIIGCGLVLNGQPIIELM